MAEDKPKVIKHDSGKSPVFQGVFRYFPRALQAVADISGFGAKKYSWGGWKKSSSYSDIDRFENALGRHLTAEEIDGLWDKESHLLHAAHAAWNALARLELLLTVFPMVDPDQILKQRLDNINEALRHGKEDKDAQGADVPSAAGGFCVASEPRPANAIWRR